MTFPTLQVQQRISTRRSVSLTVILFFLPFLSNWSEASVVSKKVILAPIPGLEGQYQVVPPKRSPTRKPASNGLPDVEPSGLSDLDPSSSSADLEAGGFRGAKKAAQAPLDLSQLPVLKELPTTEMIESGYSIPNQSGKQFYVALGGDLSLTLLERQVGTLTLGYHSSFMDFFLRGKFGPTSWGFMEARPSTEDQISTTNTDGETYPSYNDLDSEYNRVRTPQDRWTVLDVQVGLGYKANLLPVIFPKFSQGAYFTVGTGNYIDAEYDLQFLPLIFGFEAVMQYHLGEGKRWAIEGRVGYQYGHLMRVGAASEGLGHLPVRWVDGGVSLVLWF